MKRMLVSLGRMMGKQSLGGLNNNVMIMKSKHNLVVNQNCLPLQRSICSFFNSSTTSVVELQQQTEDTVGMILKNVMQTQLLLANISQSDVLFFVRIYCTLNKRIALKPSIDFLNLFNIRISQIVWAELQKKLPLADILWMVCFKGSES